MWFVADRVHGLPDRRGERKNNGATPGYKLQNQMRKEFSQKAKSEISNSARNLPKTKQKQTRKTSEMIVNTNGREGIIHQYLKESVVCPRIKCCQRTNKCSEYRVSTSNWTCMHCLVPSLSTFSDEISFPSV